MLHSKNKNQFPSNNEIANQYIKDVFKNRFSQEIFEPQLLEMVSKNWDKEIGLIQGLNRFLLKFPNNNHSGLFISDLYKKTSIIQINHKIAFFLLLLMALPKELTIEVAEQYIKDVFKDYNLPHKVLEPMLLNMMVKNWDKEIELLSQLNEFLLKLPGYNSKEPLILDRSKIIDIISLNQTISLFLRALMGLSI